MTSSLPSLVSTAPLKVGVDLCDTKLRGVFCSSAAAIEEVSAERNLQLPGGGMLESLRALRSKLPAGQAFQTVLAVPSFLSPAETEGLVRVASEAGLGSVHTLAAPAALVLCYVGLLPTPVTQVVAAAYLTNGTVDLGVFEVIGHRVLPIALHGTSWLDPSLGDLDLAWQTCVRSCPGGMACNILVLGGPPKVLTAMAHPLEERVGARLFPRLPGATGAARGALFCASALDWDHVTLITDA